MQVRIARHSWLTIYNMQVRIVSAHRTPEMMFSYALSARDRGIQIIIAGAGGAAHLPG
jgi:phosphoribosylaminoimidazole carboxylase